MGDIMFQMSFPTTYGKTRFVSMDDVKQKAAQRQPDAVGLLAQCHLYGVGVSKWGDAAIDDLFESAKAGCSDAILYLGRLYEQGAGFIPKDLEQAVCLYKYAYSLENADALHNLGFVLFSTVPNKKAIGLAMMKLSAQFGSKGAQFHLSLLGDRVTGVEEMSFYDIPKSEFKFDKNAAMDSVTLYSVDIKSVSKIKNALLDVLVELGAATFSEAVTAFRIKFLRGREYELFTDVPFEEAFEELKFEKQIEKVDMSTLTNPEGYGAAEDTLYRAKFATQSKNLVTNDLNAMFADLGLDLDDL